MAGQAASSFATRNKHPLVAQLVEQLPFKETVVGSIPTEGTKLENFKFHTWSFLILIDNNLNIHSIKQKHETNGTRIKETYQTKR